MNQILDYGVGGNNNDDNGKFRKTRKKKEKVREENFGADNGNIGYSNSAANSGVKISLSDKVIKVFALLMIVLAVALIVSGGTTIVKNKKDVTVSKVNEASSEKVQANITAEISELTGRVTFTVESPIIIDKIIYSWNTDHDNVISGEKQTSHTEEILAPNGENVLHIQVTDEQQNKTTKDFTFNSMTGRDIVKPEITLTVTEDKKLLVTSTDDTAIAFVTYAWNDGDVITMTPERQDLQEYSFELDIPRGKNTIVVTAVDGSEISNAKTTSKVLEGVTKPEITYGFLDPEGAVLQIMCSHETGIESIYYTLNGLASEWKTEEGADPVQDLSFTVDSVAGRNEMLITVTSIEGTVAEYNWVWDYNVTTENTGSQTGNTNVSDVVVDSNTGNPTNGVVTTENSILGE